MNGSNGKTESTRKVGPPGFEPGSWDPEPHMMDRYTRGLSRLRIAPTYFNATDALQPQTLPREAMSNQNRESLESHHHLQILEAPLE